MVVAALYNIVDQIFIGWSEAGAYGNAATNIVYPFTVFALGIALLIGDGAAAGFSIALGSGDKKQANKNVGNGFILLICLALILCVFGMVCRTKILALFGGNPEEAECYAYAVDYFKIICAGIPFYMIGQILTFGMSIYYITKSKNFKIDKDAVKISGSTMGKIISIGMASLIVQLSIVVIIAVNNNLLTRYGYQTFASTGQPFGAVIPLAGLFPRRFISL